MPSKPVKLVISAIALSLGLSSCAPSADNFPRAMWKSLCKKMLECYEDSTYLYFEDLDECVEVFDEYSDYMGDYYDDCDYDRASARRCLSSYDRAPCETDEWDDDKWEELWDDCEAVWDCR